MNINYSDKVVIVGNGIAGHYIALRLAELDIPTVLLDAGATGNEATLANEGWLHLGTFHSGSQATDLEAVSVARRTQLGAARILAEFPEAVEQPGDFSVALVTEAHDLEHVRRRWALCDVRAAQLTRSSAACFLPELDLTSVQAAFVVQDQPIHTGRLLGLLRRKFLSLGGEIVSGFAARTDGFDIEIHHPDRTSQTVTPRMCVWAAGYSGAEGVRELLEQHQIQTRFWRSHLLVTAPLSARSWFELHSGGVGLMHHRDHAVIGINDDVVDLGPLSRETEQDGVRAALLSVAVQKLDQGLRRLGLGASGDSPSARVTSCTKIDLVGERAEARDLKPSCLFVTPGMMVAFPGKMTEAPVLAVEACTQIRDALDQAGDPVRVGDWWTHAQNFLVGPSPQKATLRVHPTTVAKTHRSAARARFEAWLVQDLAETALAVPSIQAVTSSKLGTTVSYERLPLDPTDRGADALEVKIAKLALFHHRFRLGRSPLSLYRDSADSNEIWAGGAGWDVDFSSSNHVRHMLDDVAVLMETRPDDGHTVPPIYRRWLHHWEQQGEPRSILHAGLRAGGVTFKDLLDSAYRTHLGAVEETTETPSWTRAEARARLAGISFLELRWQDLAWFREFRVARVLHYGGNPETSIAHAPRLASA